MVLHLYGCQTEEAMRNISLGDNVSWDKMKQVIENNLFPLITGKEFILHLEHNDICIDESERNIIINAQL